MQKFSKEELQPQADVFMKAHGVDTFLATEDGNFFHPKDKSLAHDHNAKHVKGEVLEFTNGKKKETAPASGDKGSKSALSEDVERHGQPLTEAEIAAAKEAAEKEAADKKAAADKKSAAAKAAAAKAAVDAAKAKANKKAADAEKKAGDAKAAADKKADVVEAPPVE